MGQAADPQVLASFGLYDDPELQVYVRDLGMKIAAQSERPHLPWKFSVVDDPIVNAFAVPWHTRTLSIGGAVDGRLGP